MGFTPLLLVGSGEGVHLKPFANGISWAAVGGFFLRALLLVKGEVGKRDQFFSSTVCPTVLYDFLMTIVGSINLVLR